MYWSGIEDLEKLYKRALRNRKRVAIWWYSRRSDFCMLWMHWVMLRRLLICSYSVGRAVVPFDERQWTVSKRRLYSAMWRKRSLRRDLKIHERNLAGGKVGNAMVVERNEWQVEGGTWDSQTGFHGPCERCAREVDMERVMRWEKALLPNGQEHEGVRLTALDSL